MKKVDVLVVGAGDNISSLFLLQYYSYYDCTESIKYIQVWFKNNSAQLLPGLFNYFISMTD